MTLLLEARNICKAFGTTTVLDGLSLSISQREVVCVLGTSGAGKTTLLRCLNMLEQIDAGFLSYGGHHVLAVGENGSANGHAATSNGVTNGATNASTNGAANGTAVANGTTNGVGNGTKRHRSRRRARRNLLVNPAHFRRKFGVVLPEGNLNPARTILESIIEGPVYVLRQRRKDAILAARELLQLVRLSDRGDAYPDELSRSEQCRAALARALAMKPEILLIDEITAGLYPPDVVQLLEILRIVHEKHDAAMVIVTHHLAFAREIATRICFLENGRITDNGDPKQVLGAPKSEGLREFLNCCRATQ